MRMGRFGIRRVVGRGGVSCIYGSLGVVFGRKDRGVYDTQHTSKHTFVQSFRIIVWNFYFRGFLP